MSGDFGGHQRRAASERTVRRKPPRVRWWMVYSALLFCLVTAVWMGRTAPTESVAPARVDVGNHQTELRQRGAAMLIAAQKARLEDAALGPQPDTMARRQAGAPDPEPDTVATSTAPAATAPATIASLPEPQGSTPAPAVSPDVQPPGSEQEAILRHPEAQAPAQAPASNAVTPPTEHLAPRADTIETLPDAQGSKLETAVQTSEPEVNIATPQQAMEQRPRSKTPAPPSDKHRPGSQGHGRKEEKDLNADKVLAVPQLILPDDVAQKVGHKVWMNETGGNRDAITSWNAGEEFASLGIGHFLWFPAGKPAPFEESFPPMLEFLRQQNAHLPPWLDQTPIPPCPWTSRADFQKNFNSPRMRELRQFLLDTVAGQAQYLVTRAQGALAKILQTSPDGAQRTHIITQFSRMVQASKDLYPLVDYIEFKGEGINPAETAFDKQTGERQGWGLKQVLLKMNGTTIEPKAVLAEYADAAQSVLRQRVRNIPANRAWEPGWLRRVDTYRRPLVEVALNSKLAGGKSSRAKSRERK
ncbi:hypothetical protein ABH994_006294 [Bradyrhizobium yuanmingense]|uniref:hypothetical protein n=1 Tax=Bradyrhizobium yuanmingense TaxID=108015 RepID=UPI00351666F3